MQTCGQERRPIRVEHMQLQTIYKPDIARNVPRVCYDRVHRRLADDFVFLTAVQGYGNSASVLFRSRQLREVKMCSANHRSKT